MRRPTTGCQPACKPADLDYDESGCRCGRCGRTWPLTKRSDGTVIGYLTPPMTPAERRNRYAGWVD